jgi:exosortase
MYPFPSRLERSLLFPLKSASTKASHFALETLGIECYTEGNRIMLDGVDLGVVDACSGLRMFTIFLALAGGIALVTSRPIWERVAIFLSAIPISLAVNSIRITLTGLAYHFLGSEGEVARIIKMVLHDFAGWIMMPMALGLLYLIYQILAHVIIEEEPESLSPIGA